MSIKILGGFARGQTLIVPKSDLVRPTSILLRRRVYDFFQNLNDCVFVDICAGSGAMGFEAWSRGASVVYLNEANKHVVRALEENRETILLRNDHKKTGQIICSHTTAEKFIIHFKTIYQKFTDEQKQETIIFLDPPYSQKSIYFDVVKELVGKEGEESWYFGQLWIESDPLKGIAKETWAQHQLCCDKLFEQSDSYIMVTNFPQTPKV